MTDLQFTPATDLDPEFTITTASQHSTLAGRSTAGAHPAAAVTYDNGTSGLAADTVQEAIDELADAGGAVDSVNGETGTVVLDAADVDAVPVESVGLLPGETNRGTWDVAATYAVGDVVLEAGGDLYVATAPSTGAQPSLTPGSWDVLDSTGRHVHLGPGATSGGYGTAIATGATAGDYGTAIATGATAGVGGTAIGPYATSGVGGTAIAPGATTGDYGVSIGYAVTSGDYGVNIANIYKGTIDPGDPTVPTGATITTGFIDFPETVDATNPAADHQRLIARTDGLYVRDETGTEVGPLGAGGGGGIPETLIDAAGDLIVGTAADTAGRLAVGTSGQVLTSNGTTAAWATPSSTPAEVFIPAATLHGSTAVQSNWSTYPTRAHAFHQLNDSTTSTIGAMVGKSIPWTSVDIYAVVGNPSAGTGDVRWTLYYGKNAGSATTRSSVSTTTAIAAGAATYPTPQRVKVGNAIAWDTAGDWSLVLSRLGSDGADTLATAIFLQGIAIRQAGT